MESRTVVRGVGGGSGGSWRMMTVGESDGI